MRECGVDHPWYIANHESNKHNSLWSQAENLIMEGFLFRSLKSGAPIYLNIQRDNIQAEIWNSEN